MRSASKSIRIFLEKTKQSLGDIDKHRSYFETHKGAVYLHRGKSYIITRFDHKEEIIEAKREDLPYFTKARSSKNTQIIKQIDSCTVNGTKIGFGILKIIEQVTGFHKRLITNQKSIGIVPLDLPELQFETHGLWIEIPDALRDKIETDLMHFMGGIHALEHAAIGIMPLLVMTDRNDLGGISIPFHPQIEKAAVFIYDGAPGGLGLSRQAFENSEKLLQRTFDAIATCKCETGCPACVHSPKCGSGNRPIEKASALKILQLILNASETNQLPKTIKDNLNIEINKQAQDSISEEIINYDSAEYSQKNLRYGVLDLETRRDWQNTQILQAGCKSDKRTISLWQKTQIFGF